MVKASFGAGAALRGEWYYEKNTGFLVGGNRTTALSDEGEGIHFVLVESNTEHNWQTLSDPTRLLKTGLGIRSAEDVV